MTNKIIDIIKEVESAQTVGISGHISPDGDCIGASLAVYLYLKKRKPSAKILVIMEEPGERFHYLKGVDCFISKPEEDINFDVFFALDCTYDRMGEAKPYYEKAKKKINIDHHISNSNGCGDINYIVPDASATSELIYQLIDKDYLDREIAEAIYLGITHDTGVFAYSNTKPKTLRIAAELIEFGFDFPELLDKTFYEKTFTQNKAMGYALTHCYLLCDGKLIVGTISKKEMDELNVTGKDLDGIVSQLRLTSGTECALFIHQIGNERYKGSLRSKGIVDVSVIASAYGGGGHVRAAGFFLNGNQNEVIHGIEKMVVEQIASEQMK